MGEIEGWVHCGWILDGKVIQDVWVTSDPPVWEMGTTVRFYDPEIDAWHSTWISPGQRVVRRFTGKQIGREIVLKTGESSEDLMNWIFYEISKDSFRWRAERSNNGGKSWNLVEEMLIERASR